MPNSSLPSALAVFILVLVPISASAELIKPLNVPEELPPAQRAYFLNEKGTLQSRWEKDLAPYLRMHNATCSSVEVGTPLATNCEHAKTGLEAELKAYLAAVQDFNSRMLQEVVCAADQGAKALTQSLIEDMYREAQIPFDTPGCKKGSLPPVVIPAGPKQPIVVPESVIKDPAYQKLDKQLANLKQEHQMLEKELDELNRRRELLGSSSQAAEKKKNAEVQVQIVLKKTELFRNEKETKAKEREMRDLSIKEQDLKKP